MVIKRSSGQEVQALIAELQADDEVRREAAVARLAVIGTRAVDKLLALLGQPAAAATHGAALRALESIGDVRALAPACSLLASPDANVATAAVGVLSAFLHSKHDSEVLDPLVAFALDASRPHAARLAALDALTGLGSRALGPVWEQLRDDPELAVRQRAARETGHADPLSELEAAAQGVLPPDGDALGPILERAGTDAPLATLHRLIATVREREQKDRSPEAGERWLRARGTVHLALARRQSRVALYDLRETIEGAAAPLPAAFVDAIAELGDAASLEAIANAYERAPGPDDEPWRRQLASAFEAIALREGVGRRHAVARHIETKWPRAAAVLVSKLSRSTQGSKRASRT